MMRRCCFPVLQPTRHCTRFYKTHLISQGEYVKVDSIDSYYDADFDETSLFWARGYHDGLFTALIGVIYKHAIGKNSWERARWMVNVTLSPFASRSTPPKMWKKQSSPGCKLVRALHVLCQIVSSYQCFRYLFTHHKPLFPKL